MLWTTIPLPPSQQFCASHSSSLRPYLCMSTVVVVKPACEIVVSHSSWCTRNISDLNNHCKMPNIVVIVMNFTKSRASLQTFRNPRKAWILLWFLCTTWHLFKCKLLLLCEQSWHPSDSGLSILVWVSFPPPHQMLVVFLQRWRQLYL